MNPQPSRMTLIDALKAVASQLIVLHHLVLYGPLAIGAGLTFPELREWLSDYGRIAVQVFLVIGGFLAARSLAPAGRGLQDNPLNLIARRYLRLAVPFVIAISLAIICSAIADHLMDDEAIPARASIKQWLSHALLLHGILGVESLSAGVWYVAIDFQLYALMAVLLWLGHSAFGTIGARSLVLGLAAASLFWFNLDSNLDNWAIYFFGSYGLGAAACWASERRPGGNWLGIVAVITVIALLIDFRLRIGLALGVALLLGYSQHSQWPERWLNARPLAFLGRISYSVFLIHFPVLLLANGLFVFSGSASPEIACLVLLAAWLASTLAGTAFHRWVEKPAARLRWPTTVSRPVPHAPGNIPAPRD
jgi:peptidoglycan/LPS O-acetylase OafA/YrhL